MQQMSEPYETDPKMDSKTKKIDMEESSCGIGSFRPGALQCCKTILSFSIFYGLVNMVTQTLGTYINSQVTAIEKQFNLNSATTGIILSSNDIGFLLTVLFISHFGRNGHIPKVFAVSALIFGISGIMASLCYLIDPYKLPKLSEDDLRNSSGSRVFMAPLCSPGMDEKEANCIQSEASEATTGNSWQVWLLCISMALQGVAKAPRQPLSITYIDNNTEKTNTAFYLGITTTMMLLGPAMAFVFGGLFRNIPIDLQDTVLTPFHPKWIGAWWMGFLLFGSLSLLVAVPMLFFPKHILPQKKMEKEKENKISAVYKIKDLPNSVLRILRRPVYVLTLCGILCQMFILAGKQAFNSKYVEKQFMQPASKTNIILGIQTIISAGVGTLSGGIVASRLKLKRIGCIKFALVSNLVTMITIAMHYFLGCETPFIHGFHDKSAPTTDECSCDSVSYFPVCAEDGSNYFSPCHAGCTNQTNAVYGGCSQIASGQATAGLCETDCPYLYYYLAVDVVQNLVGTLPILPVYVTLIRSVEDRDKTIAIGIFSFLTSLAAFLPAPVLYGYMIDTACVVWSSTCGVKGTCLQYDLYDLRITLQSAYMAGKGLFCLFFVAAFIVLKRQGGDKEEAKELTMGPSRQEKSSERVKKGLEEVKHSQREFDDLRNTEKEMKGQREKEEVSHL